MSATELTSTELTSTDPMNTDIEPTAEAAETEGAAVTSDDPAAEPSEEAADIEELGTLMWADPAELVLGINTRTEVRRGGHRRGYP